MDTNLQIFVTGVVGRAMGSGSFAPSDIDALTRAALAAFQAHLAPLSTSGPSEPSRSPSASQSVQRGGVAAGYQAAAVISQDGAIKAETAPIHEWSNQKAYYGKRDGLHNGKPIREVSWGEWLADATAGDENALYALKNMSDSKLGPDPKWHRADIAKIGRAKRCLELVNQAK